MSSLSKVISLSLISVVISTLDGCLINGKFLSHGQNLRQRYYFKPLTWLPTFAASNLTNCTLAGSVVVPEKCHAPENCFRAPCHNLPDVWVEGQNCRTHIEGDKRLKQFWESPYIEGNYKSCLKPQKGIDVGHGYDYNYCLKLCAKLGVDGCCASDHDACTMYPGGKIDKNDPVVHEYYYAAEIRTGPDCLLPTPPGSLAGDQWLLNGQTASYADLTTCSIQTCKEGRLVQTPEQCPDVSKEQCDGKWVKQHKSCCSVCVPANATIKSYTIENFEHAL